MNVLVVGLGIGKLYVEQATKLGWYVDTVDVNPNAGATFTSVPMDMKYDLGIVCVPNYLHLDIAAQLIAICDKVLVEKPGFATKQEWVEFSQQYPNRVFLVKNNCFRDIFYGMGLNFDKIESIHFNWLNRNRVPKPGSWFTTKEKAFGGVSRDLLPHLIQAAVAMVRYDIDNLAFVGGVKQQNFELADIVKDSDRPGEYAYGEIVPNGTYDVDDLTQAEFLYGDVSIICTATWKSKRRIYESRLEWVVQFKDGTKMKYNAGLCPDYAYGTMLEAIMQEQAPANLEIHRKMDELVHEVIDNLLEVTKEFNPVKV